MSLRKTLPSCAAIILMALLWQIIAVTAGQPELIPPLPELFRTSAELLGTLSFYQSVGATISRGIAGILLSLVCAGIIAYSFSRLAWLYELCRPLLAIMRSVPVISFILIALIFLDPEQIPIMIAFLTMFPLLAENLASGIRSLDPGLSVMARQFRIGKMNRFLHVIYPQLRPFLFSGLASATGFGWRAIIMGEVLSQCAWGIGSEMKKAQNFIAVPELLAWTIAAIIISFLFDKGIGRLAKITPPLSFTKGKRTLPGQEIPALPRLTVREIGYRYGIQGFSYDFERGKIYGISAPSGKGKTTLLQLIGGISRPTTGSISPLPAQGIATVFQSPELLPHLDATDNICLPLTSLYSEEKAREIARTLLKWMEIEACSGQYPETLSYGQRQRVALARALAYPSPLLLMDEPFKGLDEALTSRIIKRIRERSMNPRQIILFTSHNPEELRELADEVITL